MDCLFCQIAAGTIPADKEFEDDDVVVFKDIHPKAPVHLLIVPKKHLASLSDSQASDQLLLGQLLLTVKDMAAKKGLSGYKTIINTGKEGGQIINHLHLHLLGGKTQEEI